MLGTRSGRHNNKRINSSNRCAAFVSALKIKCNTRAIPEVPDLTKEIENLGKIVFICQHSFDLQ